MDTCLPAFDAKSRNHREIFKEERVKCIGPVLLTNPFRSLRFAKVEFPFLGVPSWFNRPSNYVRL